MKRTLAIVTVGSAVLTTLATANVLTWQVWVGAIAIGFQSFKGLITDWAKAGQVSQ